jgi:hypothetical protein
MTEMPTGSVQSGRMVEQLPQGAANPACPVLSVFEVQASFDAEVAQRHGSPTAAGNGRWQRIQRPKSLAHRNRNVGRRFGCIRLLAACGSPNDKGKHNDDC